MFLPAVGQRGKPWPTVIVSKEGANQWLLTFARVDVSALIPQVGVIAERAAELLALFCVASNDRRRARRNVRARFADPCRGRGAAKSLTREITAHPIDNRETTRDRTGADVALPGGLPAPIDHRCSVRGPDYLRRTFHACFRHRCPPLGHQTPTRSLPTKHSVSGRILQPSTPQTVPAGAR